MTSTQFGMDKQSLYSELRSLRERNIGYFKRQSLANGAVMLLSKFPFTDYELTVVQGRHIVFQSYPLSSFDAADLVCEFTAAATGGSL